MRPGEHITDVYFREEFALLGGAFARRPSVVATRRRPSVAPSAGSFGLMFTDAAHAVEGGFFSAP